jgi:hypothetical protein
MAYRLLQLCISLTKIFTPVKNIFEFSQTALNLKKHYMESMFQGSSNFLPKEHKLLPHCHNRLIKSYNPKLTVQ